MLASNKSPLQLDCNPKDNETMEDGLDEVVGIDPAMFKISPIDYAVVCAR